MSPGKVLMTKAKPRMSVVFGGWQFHCYPLVQSIFFVLTNTLSTLRLFSKQSRLSEYMHAHFVYCTFKRSDYVMKHTLIKYAQVILIFFSYNPSSSIFTCCQVPSHIRAWFHDSAGDNIYRYLWTGYEGVSKFMVSRDLNYDPTRSWGS